MEYVITTILGPKGIVITIGTIVFLYCLRYSTLIFDWIENQTFGTRAYIQERLELLFIEVPAEKLSMYLLFFSLSLFMVTLLFFGTLVNWILGIILAIPACILSFRVPKLLVDYLVQRRVKQYQGTNGRWTDSFGQWY